MGASGSTGYPLCSPRLCIGCCLCQSLAVVSNRHGGESWAGEAWHSVWLPEILYTSSVIDSLRSGRGAIPCRVPHGLRKLSATCNGYVATKRGHRGRHDIRGGKLCREALVCDLSHQRGLPSAAEAYSGDEQSGSHSNGGGVYSPAHTEGANIL